MADFPTTTSSLHRATDDRPTELRIAKSVHAREGELIGLTDFHTWFADYSDRVHTQVTTIPLESLSGWSIDQETGNISHHSGKFFTVEGLEVHVSNHPVAPWSQPIINQPEVGILGILVKEWHGTLHCLMQAKFEPGNDNRIQLCPTVQATRSNYTRVHGGKSVPYLEYFLDSSAHRVIADVRQSEQGAWFDHKRNRNMVIEVDEPVELLEGFCWLTLGQLHQLLTIDDLVNMDARTVLSCLPFTGNEVLATVWPGTGTFRASLIRSMCPDQDSLHPTASILSWITDARTRVHVSTHRVPLAGLPRWSCQDGRISHDSGAFFDVIGVAVQAGDREVTEWTQPMFQPHGTGVVAFVVANIDGVLHALMHARVEPGFLDVVELAPTVQCTPENYDHLPPAARPRFLDHVLGARPGQIRFDTILSEEGGRFYCARTRYLVVEVPAEAGFEDQDFRWLTLHQVVDLLRHSHYVNVQARSLVACLHSLSGA